ncbi:TetR/AcrR family transcriptional regulator [Kibdelosporangium phytohabitans]|uniref:TetR family transcriptional regulator n=1 Tax=Kibdelosporangium phytohabitans TaxID=860235 RepID=A0A0N9I8U9_9PSEU|nr:TetR/AcrR family transcriptional regulator C-terminal domain-containing protein [Kibdelosporangium phytohabitans]ALG11333.1 TetR family transcriptional regulator [Kibdelosporangium phytohabitans]MBE1462642.1 AcrR family transcriptional regulator [Kibdelosporangium phytohabitans]
MVVYAGQGENKRTMALLWRAHGAVQDAEKVNPGPKQGLSVDEIVDAAIGLADTEGMNAVSMRTVGKVLGRSGMALYTYVPSKGELVDLMHDRALGELPTQYDVSRGWRPAVVAWANDLWAFFLRHPWVLQVSSARPVLGPNEFASMDTLVRLFDGVELPALLLRRIVGTLASFVRGSVQTIAESRQAPGATGISDEDWWYARSAALQAVVPDFAERYSALIRLETEGATPPDDDCTPYMERESTEQFKAGLEVLLDGIDASITKAAASAGDCAGAT